MPSKLASQGLFKKLYFEKNRYDVLISVQNGINKILSSDPNLL